MTIPCETIPPGDSIAAQRTAFVGSTPRYGVMRLAVAFVLGLLLSGSGTTWAVATEELGQAAIHVARSTPTTTKPPNRSESAEATMSGLPVKPRVVLSHEHSETCRKRVGDLVDRTEVIDFRNQRHQIHDLLSDRLTVLIFWNEESLLATEQFRRIPLEVLASFASYRVKVIAVHVRGNAEQTRIQTGDAADKIVSLVDTDGQLFGQFANSRIPRTYVLDADGRILWFDIEYSHGMVHSLANALTYYLTVDQ